MPHDLSTTDRPQVLLIENHKSGDCRRRGGHVEFIADRCRLAVTSHRRWNNKQIWSNDHSNILHRHTIDLVLGNFKQETQQPLKQQEFTRNWTKIRSSKSLRNCSLKLYPGIDNVRRWMTSNILKLNMDDVQFNFSGKQQQMNTISWESIGIVWHMLVFQKLITTWCRQDTCLVNTFDYTSNKT